MVILCEGKKLKGFYLLCSIYWQLNSAEHVTSHNWVQYPWDRQESFLSNLHLELRFFKFALIVFGLHGEVAVRGFVLKQTAHWNGWIVELPNSTQTVNSKAGLTSSTLQRKKTERCDVRLINDRVFSHLWPVRVAVSPRSPPSYLLQAPAALPVKAHEGIFTVAAASSTHTAALKSSYDFRGNLADRDGRRSARDAPPFFSVGGCVVVRGTRRWEDKVVGRLSDRLSLAVCLWWSPSRCGGSDRGSAWNLVFWRWRGSGNWRRMQSSK